jgi:hypothetical protein
MSTLNNDHDDDTSSEYDENTQRPPLPPSEYDYDENTDIFTSHQNERELNEDVQGGSGYLPSVQSTQGGLTGSPSVYSQSSQGGPTGSPSVPNDHVGTPNSERLQARATAPASVREPMVRATAQTNERRVRATAQTYEEQIRATAQSNEKFQNMTRATAQTNRNMTHAPAQSTFSTCATVPLQNYENENAARAASKFSFKQASENAAWIASINRARGPHGSADLKYDSRHRSSRHNEEVTLRFFFFSNH